MPKLVRCFIAECLGTFALVFIGDGSIAQVVCGNALNGNEFFGGFLNIALGYGLALMVGILISGGVSGGHLNPAVTLAMTCIKKLEIMALPVYMAAQYVGAFFGALTLRGIYADGIRLTEELKNHSKSSTMGIFASYPADKISTANLALDQMLGTAILLIIILAVTDSRNMKLSSSLVALSIGLGLTAIHLSMGFNAGCAINPARDLGPRLVTLITGWDSEPFKAGDNFWWIPFLLPHIGALIGAAIYMIIELSHPKPNEETKDSKEV